ncbi:MAG: HlyD family efflux transporter periplasmic adaptor subunit [Candidatus Vogelbacteria bacterium]|nr:HlyD family efflux transporter periplasmic adaptor subunit [Candidatus Vogelbacteria bacterium]
MAKIKTYLLSHRLLSLVFFLLVALGGYLIYRQLAGSSSGTSYVFAQVRRETLVSTVSGTGQVSAVNQIALTSKVSGNVSWVGYRVGDRVGTGATIAQIGGSDAANAAFDLENARISYAKLISGDPTTLIKARDSVTSAQNAIDQDYSSAFNSITKTYNDGNAALDQIDNLYAVGGYLYTTSNQQGSIYVSPDMSDKLSATKKDYLTAKTDFQSSMSNYSVLSAGSDRTQIEKSLDEAYGSAKKLVQAVKNMLDLLNYLKAREIGSLTLVNTAITATNSSFNTVSTDSANLLSAKNTLVADKRSLVSVNSSLGDSQSGSVTDRRTQELAVNQKEQSLADYSISSPINGVIGSLAVAKGDAISNGTAIATVISDQKIAQIPLNEIDVAKVKVGNKAILKFDALPGVTASGTVTEIAGIGTVTQGVVSYDTKVSIDSVDERIKPGMSASVTIVTDSRPDVLVVPASAVKSNLRGSYVQTLPGTVPSGPTPVVSSISPTQVRVKTGQSNDNLTEIVSGLKEGDYVVARTLTATSAASPAGQTGGAGSASPAAGAGRQTRQLIGGGRGFGG